MRSQALIAIFFLLPLFCFTSNLLAAPVGFRSFSFFLGQGVSDNINQEPEGEEDASLITDAGIGVILGGIGKNYEIDVIYNGVFEFFWQDADESRFVHDLSAIFSYAKPISQRALFRFSITDTLNQQPINIRGTEGVNNLTIVNTATASSSLTYFFTPLTSSTTTLSFTRQDPFSNDRDRFFIFGTSEVINHQFSFNPRLSMSLTPLAEFLVSDQFENRVVLGGLISLSYIVSPRTQISGGIGYARVVFLDTNQSTGGIIGEAGISHIFSPRTSGSIVYNRSFNTDVDLGDEFLSDAFVGTLNHQFAPDVDSSISAYLQRRDFRETDLGSETLYGGSGALNKQISPRFFGSLQAFFGVFDFFDRKEEEVRGTAVLTYQLTPHWFVSLNYSHIRQFSDDSEFEFTENVGFISISYGTGTLPGLLPYFPFSGILAPSPITPINPAIPPPPQAPSPPQVLPSPPPSEEVPPSGEEGI